MSDKQTPRDFHTVAGERIGMAIFATWIVFLLWSSRAALLQMMTS